MSKTVVRFKPGFFSDDPHCEVPDMGDFEDLKEKLSAVSKLCETAVTKQVFETCVAEAERNIADIKQQTEDILKSFLATITSGEWRDGFKRDVGRALEQLERRYAAINDELNRKIEELSKVSELETTLSQKILDFQEEVRRMISDSASSREQLNRIKENAVENADNHMDHGAQEVRWGVEGTVEIEKRITLLEKRTHGMGCLAGLSVVGALVAFAALIILVALR